MPQTVLDKDVNVGMIRKILDLKDGAELIFDYKTRGLVRTKHLICVSDKRERGR